MKVKLAQIGAGAFLWREKLDPSGVWLTPSPSSSSLITSAPPSFLPYLIWSCTRRRTSTPRPSPSKLSPSPTRRSRVGLGLGWDGLGWDVLVLLRVQLQCNVDEKGGKYTEAQPRCTCPQFESTLLRSLWWITECNSNAKFTRREASTPRRSRGVLVLPTSQLCIQVGEVHVQLLMDLMLVHWRFCYCKRVRIDWAEWLSEPIWNTNAMRVSEYIILPKDAW